MKQKSSFDPILDCMKIDLDIGLYLDDDKALGRAKKKRNSVVILNLKKQMNKDSKFINSLCRSSVIQKDKRPEPRKTCSLALPIIDQSSEGSCASPMQNTVLRTIQTPLSISISKYPSDLYSKLASSGKIEQKKGRSSSGKSKGARKRIFMSSERYQPFRINITQKLKKRSLHSEIKNMKMFDTREIMNITNGVFDFGKFNKY